MISYSVYIIDDEQSIRDALTFGLGNHYRIRTFANAEDGLIGIKEEIPDLVLLDIGLPGMDGVTALKEIKSFSPETLVIMITAFEDIDTVLSAMKAGAYDYIVKPLHLDSIKLSIKHALETISMRKEIQSLQEQSLKESVPCFVSESDLIQDVMQFVGKIAKSPDTPVLIMGETGTGKELIASAVHYKSPNFKGPFISINCAAIPKDLIESELFGYEKGAFSGAAAAGKKGLIEEAEGGTLFLDEVGDLSSSAQAKLLRFLEDGEYYRVGGTQKYTIKTRIVSATNRNLEEMIEQNQFRQDLYFRIAVVKVEVPSLNDRPEDIIPIAQHFLSEFSDKHDKTFTNISEEVKQFFKEYQWKGNVRELRNLIERGVLIGVGPFLKLEDLGVKPNLSGSLSKENISGAEFPELPAEGIMLEDLEAHYVREAYAKADGNEKKAAQLLGMTYYAYRYKRKKMK